MKNKYQASHDRLFQEMSIILQKDGFKTEPSDDECMTVLFDGQPLCKIADTGGIRYRESDIGTSDREDALHQVITEAKTISEYISMMENAPALPASGLDQNYMLLADFNGVVLAGHPTHLGVQFVTWDWDYDGQGVSQGNYFSNSYVGAKKDFAVRSGLIQKQQIFSSEQLTELYRCMESALDRDAALTYEQEKQLGEISCLATTLK